jgi:hypothetical protein
MIERLQTRDVFPAWLDGGQGGTRFLRVNGAGKVYLSLIDDRETLYVFTGDWLPKTIMEAIEEVTDMFDELS